MFRWATILMRFGSWDLIDLITCVRVGVDDQLYEESAGCWQRVVTVVMKYYT